MAKKENNTEIPEALQDDRLFEALGQKKKRKKRRIVITTVSVLTVLAVAGVVGVAFLQKQVRTEFASSSGEILSYEVTAGTISTVVSGSGSLTDVDLTTISVPEGVEVTEIKVKANQSLKKGDLLATVDMASVVSTMADLQAEIEELDKQLSKAEGDEASTKITAGVAGRVKAIFAETGTSVPEVMNEKGSLALLSLDGYMAVDIETEVLEKGDSVQVKRSSGTTVNGTVESVTNGKATVLISDNGPKYDESVTVKNSSGEEIGQGTLYVHSPLRVTGYAGTVSKVHVSENTKVSASTRIFTLKDTDYSANYKALLRTRSEKEEDLLFLLAINRNGAVLAEQDGSVYSVGNDEDETVVATLSDDKKMSVTISVDESDILSLALDQEVTISVPSVSEDSFTGVLTEIDRSVSSSGSYSAVVELDKADGMLSGMTANVSVEIEGVENAILIPIEALHKTSNGAYVYTSYNEEYQEYGGKVDVVTGLENSTYIEIKSGLSLGDTVYYTKKQSSFPSNMMGNRGNRGEMSGGFPSGGMPSGGMNSGFPSGGTNGSGFGGSGSRPDFGNRS